ncbi:MAG: universal stress protein [Candidatus Thermoplasmatota archaeon]
MYDKVVLPTDGSDLSFHGVEEGLEAAKAYGISAVAVYVIPPSAISGHRLEESGMNLINQFRKQQKDKGQKVLDKVKKMADEAGVELETEIRDGEPYEEISAVANPNDIIYICSHGRSGLKSFFIGSTTTRVLKHTETTVAVVKAD